jgi:hypothetical protein
MRSLGIIGGLGLLGWLVVRAPEPQPATSDLPGAPFQPNVGQTAAEVKFLARAKDYTLYLTGQGAVLSAGGEAVLRMEVAGADPEAEAAGQDRLAGRSHYLLGNDPSRWIREVPHYREVAYRQVYSGIDIIYHATRGRLEYDFVVSPGADPARIRLRFPGARRVGIDGRQDLVVETGAGGFRQRRPVARQGSRPVRAAYRVEVAHLKPA